MLDSYTKDMLFKNIINEYSDAEQLEIIQYLVEQLKAQQSGFYGYEKDSIEELYSIGLEKVIQDIKDLKVQEHDFLLDKEVE